MHPSCLHLALLPLVAGLPYQSPSIANQIVISSASTSPSNIPTPTEARQLLSNLTMAEQGSEQGYSRTQFPHWLVVPGTGCNTREAVLKRDGTDLVFGERCKVLNGTWISPYDGLTVTEERRVDIDHVIPLANAWRSGAAKWTLEKRRQFANDLVNPQLMAVGASVNDSKGDRGPEVWQPPLDSFKCQYASRWIKVKSVYELTATSSESEALGAMLDKYCP